MAGDGAAHLTEGVAAELLDGGGGEDERHHRLPDHAGRGHHADVAALVMGVDLRPVLMSTLRMG